MEIVKNGEAPLENKQPTVEGLLESAAKDLNFNPLMILEFLPKIKQFIPKIKEFVPSATLWEKTQIKKTGMVSADGSEVPEIIIYAAALNEQQRNAFIYVFAVAELPEDVTLSNGHVIPAGTPVIIRTIHNHSADDFIDNISQFLPGL